MLEQMGCVYQATSAPYRCQDSHIPATKGDIMGSEEAPAQGPHGQKHGREMHSRRIQCMLSSWLKPTQAVLGQTLVNDNMWECAARKGVWALSEPEGLTDSSR